jgi:hypothetical protein
MARRGFALAVSAGEVAGHHDLITGVQELVRFKAYYSGATPVLREDCPYVVHHTLGAMPSSAIWHALAVLDPINIRSQDPAGNIKITAPERLVGIPKCGHIRLRHRSILSPRVTNLRCSEIRHLSAANCASRVPSRNQRRTSTACR